MAGTFRPAELRSKLSTSVERLSVPDAPEMLLETEGHLLLAQLDGASSRLL